MTFGFSQLWSSWGGCGPQQGLTVLWSSLRGWWSCAVIRSVRERLPVLDPFEENRRGRAHLDLWGIGEHPHSHCGRSQPGSIRNTWWILHESADSLEKGTCWWSHQDSWREKWRADPMDVPGVDLDAQTAAVHLDGAEGVVFRTDVNFTWERSHSDGVPLLHQWQVVAEGPIQEQLIQITNNSSDCPWFLCKLLVCWYFYSDLKEESVSLPPRGTREGWNHSRQGRNSCTWEPAGRNELVLLKLIFLFYS